MDTEPTRRLIAGGAVALVVVILAAVALTGCGNDADEQAYVDQNEGIAESLPTFPDAKPKETKSSGYRKPQEAEFNQDIVGYNTTVHYELAKPARVERIANFYKKRLTGWRLVEAWGQLPGRPREDRPPRSEADPSAVPPPLVSSRAAVFAFQRGDAFVSLNLDNVPYGGFDVVVDHDHYGEDKFERPPGLDVRFLVLVTSEACS